jgi:phosphoglycolate phosphatase-like HAD superfamily hydrolase
MSPTLARQVEAAFANAVRARLREIVAAALEDGAPREEIYADLEAFRQRYRDEGKEMEEEIIMDVMDLFHGLGHPSLRV